MKIRVPRKLKKELCKVNRLENSKPFIETLPTISFSSSPTKYTFTEYVRVKLKNDVRQNKWTRRLIRNILLEVKRNQRELIEKEMKRNLI